MKTLNLILVIGLFFVSNISAQDLEQKKEREGEQSIEVQALMLAKNNALMGYESQNPIFLIGAAQLLIDFPSAELELNSYEEPNVDEIERKNDFVVELSAKKLLDDAKVFAQGDAATLAMINALEEKITTAQTRGAVGGPYALRRQVERFSTNRYTASFRANQLAEIAVVGDGDTDLDLFVFDINGNLIESDTNYTDQLYVSWVPRWTGEFTIVIKNHGRVYNEFILITN